MARCLLMKIKRTFNLECLFWTSPPFPSWLHSWEYFIRRHYPLFSGPWQAVTFWAGSVPLSLPTLSRWINLPSEFHLPYNLVFSLKHVNEHMLAVKNWNSKLYSNIGQFLKLQDRHQSSGDLVKGRCWLTAFLRRLFWGKTSKNALHLLQFCSLGAW